MKHVFKALVDRFVPRVTQVVVGVDELHIFHRLSLNFDLGLIQEILIIIIILFFLRCLRIGLLGRILGR